MTEIEMKTIGMSLLHFLNEFPITDRSKKHKLFNFHLSEN